MYVYVLSCFNCVQLFVTPWTAACRAPLSMGILQARILEWVAMPSSRGLPNPELEPRSPVLQTDSLLPKPPGKPKNTGVGCLALLQGIFLIQGWKLHLMSPALQVDFLLPKPPGKPKNTGMGCLFLLQGIFLTQMNSFN